MVGQEGLLTLEIFWWKISLVCLAPAELWEFTPNTVKEKQEAKTLCPLSRIDNTRHGECRKPSTLFLARCTISHNAHHVRQNRLRCVSVDLAPFSVSQEAGFVRHAMSCRGNLQYQMGKKVCAPAPWRSDFDIILPCRSFSSLYWNLECLICVMTEQVS